MMLGDDHIIYCKNVVSGWHNDSYSWIHAVKCCIMHIHAYETKKLPNMVSLITKWTPQLKTMPNDDYIIYCENIVFRWHNNCYGCIHTEKCCIMHIHTYETKKLPVGWHNHCYNWIHTEKCCITHIHTYKTKKLPNMVSLIEKWTLPLNSHWQTGPEHISYVPYWIKINMFPTWCNYYAKSMWSPHGHAWSPRSPCGVHTDRWGTVNYCNGLWTWL